MSSKNDPINDMVSEIKGTTSFISKVLFAGFNVVFLIVLGLILVSNFAIN
jgi:hypothetical protein